MLFKLMFYIYIEESFVMAIQKLVRPQHTSFCMYVCVSVFMHLFPVIKYLMPKKKTKRLNRLNTITFLHFVIYKLMI